MKGDTILDPLRRVTHIRKVSVVILIIIELWFYEYNLSNSPKKLKIPFFGSLKDILCFLEKFLNKNSIILPRKPNEKGNFGIQKK